METSGVTWSLVLKVLILGMIFIGVVIFVFKKVLFDATNSLKVTKSKMCPNGHKISDDATFCEKCGTFVPKAPSTS